MTIRSRRGVKRAPISSGQRHKYTVAFDPEHWKMLEQHCQMVGATKPQVIEAAVLSHLSGDDLDRRMDVINRALMQMQRRLGRIELHDEIIAQTLGNFVKMWLMATPELPPEQRTAAYRSAEARFEKFVNWTGEQLQQSRLWYSVLAADRIAEPPSEVAEDTPVPIVAMDGMDGEELDEGLSYE